MVTTRCFKKNDTIFEIRFFLNQINSYDFWAFSEVYLMSVSTMGEILSLGKYLQKSSGFPQIYVF